MVIANIKKRQPDIVSLLMEKHTTYEGFLPKTKPNRTKPAQEPYQASIPAYQPEEIKGAEKHIK